jgi:cobalt-zinc-cadmium efflux system protein
MTITITDQALAKSVARQVLEKYHVTYSAIEVDENLLEHHLHQEKEV